MKISTLTIKGFRCFDPTGQTFCLDNLTCFIGPNASGKTAALMALVRMFGESQGDRQIRVTDFHLAPGEDLMTVPERELSVEVRLTFPELEEESPDQSAIPETFNQMIVDAPGGTPYCRIRLTAIWINDGTPEGDIKQQLEWIVSPLGTPETQEIGSSMGAKERARIRVIYGAAARDPSRQIRSTTDGTFGRLLRAVDWDNKEEEIKKGLDELSDLFSQLPGIGVMNANIQLAWSELYDGPVAENVQFTPADHEPRALLGSLVAAFQPNEQGRSLRIVDLSDGLRALFSLSLPLGLFNVAESLKSNFGNSGFVASVLDDLPLLTLFAVEEPENHLSPHYLGKVVSSLDKIASGNNAQVILSSHSPSIMRRIEPDNVRYFLGGETRWVTQVKRIPLPKDETEESFKYVREAVRSFPELYFSRLVVLGEGPSEEIVLRKILEASGAPLDTLFISVVPLGGRHVNHFWRLLDGLEIPHITLLDLDLGRRLGGWERICQIYKELLALGKSSVSEELSVMEAATSGDAKERQDEVDKGPSASIDDLLNDALGFLEDEHDIFFSAPLDLDFSMLQAFPSAYKGQAPPSGGPRLPAMEPGRSMVIRKRARQVLSLDENGDEDDVIDRNYQQQQHLFPWYKYLFLDGSKPVAHMRALITLDTQEGWLKDLNPRLNRLAERVRQLVSGGGET